MEEVPVLSDFPCWWQASESKGSGGLPLFAHQLQVIGKQID